MAPKSRYQPPCGWLISSCRFATENCYRAKFFQISAFCFRISFSSGSTGPGEFDGDRGAGAKAAFHVALAADFRDAFAHVAQAVGLWVFGVFFESAAVVFDGGSQGGAGGGARP